MKILPVLLVFLLFVPSALWGADAGAKTSVRHLAVIDYVVIFAYLAGVLMLGLKSSKQGQKTTSDYFLGGRKISWWAAGISLYATGTSAISFMAIPAKTFHTDWKYYQATLFNFLSLIVVIIWIIPLIRRLNLVSVYEYLNQRFNRSVQLIGSAIFVVLQISGRISIVLFLPSLAISTVTGLNVYASILLMGSITMFYTVKGGFTAVIWTDVAQVIVMFGGVLLAIVLILLRIDMPFGEAWAVLQANHKVDLVDARFDLVAPTLWLFFLMEASQTVTWARDQAMLQRVLATPDVRSAKWSMWTLNLLTIPGGLLFFSLGTLLYLFYHSRPGALVPDLPNDAIFPYFVAQELPPGVVGVIIAALFAGSMGTLSSCINSVATAVVMDFGHWLPGERGEKGDLHLAKVVSIFVGLVGTGIAIVMASLGLSSMWDTFVFLSGLIGGGFGGVFALGMFTRRANWQGAIIGTVVSTLVTLWVAYAFKASAFLYGVVAVFVCIPVGYFASYLFKPPAQSLEGLTVFDAREKA